MGFEMSDPGGEEVKPPGAEEGQDAAFGRDALSCMRTAEETHVKNKHNRSQKYLNSSCYIFFIILLGLHWIVFKALNSILLQHLKTVTP